MKNEDMERAVVLRHVKRRLVREYEDISPGPAGGPDLVLKNQGLTMAVLRVETAGSVTPVRARHWAEISATDKLILMVPRNSVTRATDLVWEEGLTDRVALGSYHIRIDLP